MVKIKDNKSNLYFYKSIADKFEHLDNSYDVNRRKEIIFNYFLSAVNLENKLVLDAGCGYGAFSKVLSQKECLLVSLDIIFQLVITTIDKTNLCGCVADASLLPFEDESFDFVISSEMVEHTLNPTETVLELLRVTKYNGYLIITTPNKKWQPIVRTASRFHLRNFSGIENFLGYKQLERLLSLSGGEIIEHRGFHLIPFQFKPLLKISRYFDEKYCDRFLGRFMINQAIFVRKPMRGDPVGEDS